MPAVGTTAPSGACLVLAGCKRAARGEPKLTTTHAHHSQVTHSTGTAGSIHDRIAWQGLRLLRVPPAMMRAAAAAVSTSRKNAAKSGPLGQQRRCGQIGC